MFICSELVLSQFRSEFSRFIEFSEKGEIAVGEEKYCIADLANISTGINKSCNKR